MQLNKATLSEQIYTILKNDILDQSIPQGEKLTLKNLQERFATSSTPIRDALTRLNKGQMSAPVHSSFGWHLIELLDTRNVDKTDAAQKDRAYRMLMNSKLSEEAASWMQEQRASAYVKILSN